MRDLVALARLVKQRMRKREAKTTKWRLGVDGLRDGGRSEKERGRDTSGVFPSGTMAVALKGLVPLASAACEQEWERCVARAQEKKEREKRVKVVTKS